MIQQHSLYKTTDVEFVSPQLFVVSSASLLSFYVKGTHGLVYRENLRRNDIVIVFEKIIYSDVHYMARILSRLGVGYVLTRDITPLVK